MQLRASPGAPAAEADLPAIASPRRTFFRQTAPMPPARQSRTMDDWRAAARTSALPRRWRRVPPRAICPCAFLESAEWSSGEKYFGEFFVRVDAGPQRLDIDVLVRSVRDVNRAGPEQQGLAPVREEGDIRCVRDRTRLKPGHGRESLRRDVRAKLHVGDPLGPVEYHLLDRLDVADEPEHDLRFRVGGNDVGLGAAFDRSDVDRGFAQHGIP